VAEWVSVIPLFSVEITEVVRILCEKWSIP